MKPNFNSILKFELSEHHELTVKSIFYAMGAIHHYKNPPTAYIQVIHILMMYYDILKEKLYLDLAFFHVYAYLCAGYGYEAHKKLFNRVIYAKTHMSLKQFIKTSDCKYREIHCTTFSIRNALGRWSPQQDPTLMKTYVAAQILDNINTGQTGTFIYRHTRRGVPCPVYVSIEKEYTYIIGTDKECAKIKNEKAPL